MAKWSLRERPELVRIKIKKATELGQKLTRASGIHDLKLRDIELQLTVAFLLGLSFVEVDRAYYFELEASSSFYS